jgi:hypothetical protein
MDQFISDAERREIEALYKHIESGPHVTAAPLRCRMNWHRWSVWWTIAKGPIVGGKDNAFHVGHYLEQKRSCLRCHKTVLRKQSLTY